MNKASISCLPYLHRTAVDTENGIATEKENADRRTDAVGDAEGREGGREQGTKCKQINSDIDITNDRRGFDEQVTEQRSQRCCSSNKSALERGKTQGAVYGAQASSDPPRTEASPRSRQESVPRPLRETTQDPLLSEAATIKIVCAIGQPNATLSTRQIQGTTNRVPLCESFLELARANAG